MMPRSDGLPPFIASDPLRRGFFSFTRCVGVFSRLGLRAEDVSVSMVLGDLAHYRAILGIR
jgi:hypothetical protein